MNNIKIWSNVKIKKVFSHLKLSIMKLLVTHKLSKVVSKLQTIQNVVSKMKLIIEMLSVI
jgi:hypothetical protein